MRVLFRSRALWAAAVSAILVGMTNYFARIFLNASGNDLMKYLSGRFGMAFLAMLVLLVSGKFQIRFWGKKCAWLLVLNGVLNPILAQTLETTAILYASTAQVAIFLSLIPLFVVLFNVVLNQEIPAWRQMLFMLLTVFGVLIVRLAGGGSGEAGSFIGFLLSMLTCVVVGIQRALVRRLTAEFSPFEIIFVSSGTSTLVFTAISVVRHLHIGDLETYFDCLQVPGAFFAVFYNGVISCALGFLLMTYAAGKLPVAIAQTISLLNMPVAILAGTILLRETFTMLDGIGSVLVMIGIAGASFCYDSKDIQHNQFRLRKEE